VEINDMLIFAADDGDDDDDREPAVIREPDED
jgi:hypothetical protein